MGEKYIVMGTVTFTVAAGNTEEIWQSSKKQLTGWALPERPKVDSQWERTSKTEIRVGGTKTCWKGWQDSHQNPLTHVIF